MLLAQLTEVAKGFGTHDVLDHVHWQIRDAVRVALVGRNGSGKTTLFRLLTGELSPDRGTVRLGKGTVVAAMEQEIRVDDRRTLREEAARGLRHLEELHREFEEITRRLGEASEDDPETGDLVERYGTLQERLEREGGYSFEARVQSVLRGLHFADDDLDRPLVEFSGGEKSRAILARVLLRDPDLLLLDEPTNHLDLEAIEWLETFLQNYQGAYILVSHDRMFLNRLARETVEIRGRRLHHFAGNYDAFLVERERRLEEEARLYEQQQEEIRRQEDFIRKNIAGQKTKQAQSRRNRLQRLERLEAPEWPASSIHMRLPEPERSARIVAEAKGLAKSYGPIRVFSGISFLVQRGQKMGLIGPNGVGKTTLLRLLLGQEGPDAGTLRIGPGVQIGYFEQEQAELRGSQSVLDEVWKVTPRATEEQMRTFLGAFLFRGDMVFQALNALSGGEKSRVALAKIVREGANFLVLDEPTNHLDIESREVFEAAIQAFTGTVLVVSHDRYFLDRVADHVIELKRDGARVWEGGYSQYARSRDRGAASPPEPQAPKQKREAAAGEEERADKEERKRRYEEQRRRQRDEEKLRRRVSAAEARILELETRREALTLAMGDPSLATEVAKLQELTGQLRETDVEIERAMSDWERLETRLAAFLDGDNP